MFRFRLRALWSFLPPSCSWMDGLSWYAPLRPCSRQVPAASAASQSTTALRGDGRVVQLEVMIERGLVRLGKLLAMQSDFGRGPHPFLGHGHLQVVGADLNASQWDEGQVSTDESFLDGGELRLIGLDVHVDIL